MEWEELIVKRKKIIKKYIYIKKKNDDNTLTWLLWRIGRMHKITILIHDLMIIFSRIYEIYFFRFLIHPYFSNGTLLQF